MDLKAIQSALRDRKFDAWLFYDHHHRDPIAYRVLGLPEHTMVTRRWFYLVPASGDPHKLSHRIESHRLDSLPGKKHEYSSWQEQWDALKQMLAPYNTVAMQYSPNNQIPYIGLVDAGTIELVRSFGKNIVSSADLVSQFEATWNADQVRSHFEARDSIDRITEEFFKELGRRVRNGGTTEYEMQQWVLEAFRRDDIVTPDGPNVSVNGNSGNPHYEPTAEVFAPIRSGDFVLLDIWGHKNRPGAVFYDITWTGVVGKSPTDRQQEIFNVVRDARDVGIRTVQDAMSAGRKLHGWEVDKATRDFIQSKGYGQYFTHRTGHSIGSTDVHGNGPNMDNLETQDEREIIPYTCSSIEPGIYLPEFGVRSEINLLIREHSAEVTGKIQREIVVI
jgi:Xaa-Pro aminopeptidase